MEKHIDIRQAAELLGVDITTLRRWDKQNKLVPGRTPGGHRRYTEKQLMEFLQGNVSAKTLDAQSKGGN